MIEDQPLREPDGRPAAVGDLVARWFGTDEPGRVFRSLRVHPPATYETVFEGFEAIEVSEARQ